MPARPANAPNATVRPAPAHKFISPKVFTKSLCKSQFPQKSVNLFFIITNIKNKLTNLCGN